MSRESCTMRKFPAAMNPSLAEVLASSSVVSRDGLSDGDGRKGSGKKRPRRTSVILTTNSHHEEPSDIFYRQLASLTDEVEETYSRNVRQNLYQKLCTIRKGVSDLSQTHRASVQRHNHRHSDLIAQLAALQRRNHDLETAQQTTQACHLATISQLQADLRKAHAFQKCFEETCHTVEKARRSAHARLQAQLQQELERHQSLAIDLKECRHRQEVSEQAHRFRYTQLERELEETRKTNKNLQTELEMAQAHTQAHTQASERTPEKLRASLSRDETHYLRTEALPNIRLKSELSPRAQCSHRWNEIGNSFPNDSGLLQASTKQPAPREYSPDRRSVWQDTDSGCPSHIFNEIELSRSTILLPGIRPPNFRVLSEPRQQRIDGHQDLVLDEGDYHTVCEILKTDGTGDGFNTNWQRRVRNTILVEDGGDRRVCGLRRRKLRFDEDTEALAIPSTLARLDHLVHFDLACSSLPDELGSLTMLRILNLSSSREIRSLPPLRRTNLRELILSWCVELRELPPDLGGLTHLVRLDVSGCHNLAPLPPSIGMLKNLRELDLSQTIWPELPPAIGNLASLVAFRLEFSHVTFLPECIGNLSSLEHLDLNHTYRLTALPESIGNLSSLRSLHLERSRIRALPLSLGRLRALESLYLKETTELKLLPGELQSLRNLVTLDLSGSTITSLPSFVGRLLHLRHLDLSGTWNLSELPDELGNLVNLTSLNLSRCPKLTVLPNSLTGLTGLMELQLSGTSRLEESNDDRSTNQSSKNATVGWLRLIQKCPSLGALDLAEEAFEGVQPLGGVGTRVAFALARNRARHRMGSAGHPPSPRLWPRLLRHAPRAFARWRPVEVFEGFQGTSQSGSDSSSEIETWDAIYQLLVDDRETFLAILVNRSKSIGSGIPSVDICSNNNNGIRNGRGCNRPNNTQSAWNIVSPAARPKKHRMMSLRYDSLVSIT